jgi:hypothetical protein
MEGPIGHSIKSKGLSLPSHNPNRQVIIMAKKDLSKDFSDETSIMHADGTKVMAPPAAASETQVAPTVDPTVVLAQAGGSNDFNSFMAALKGMSAEQLKAIRDKASELRKDASVEQHPWLGKEVYCRQGKREVVGKLLATGKTCCHILASSGRVIYIRHVPNGTETVIFTLAKDRPVKAAATQAA